LQLLAWETTRACPFACPHCRASAVHQPESGELSTQEGFTLLADAAKVGPGIVILSGGEPLLRPDLEAIAREGTKLGHMMVISGNDGRLLTDERIHALKDAGVRRFSFSVHSPVPAEQDHFLARPGAFEDMRQAFLRLEQAEIPFQINTTVLPGNHRRLPEMLEAVKTLRAAAWHLFFVVKTGRAIDHPAETELSDADTETVLHWAAEVFDTPGVPPMKITCAPQHSRIFAQKGKKLPGHGRSCMAGDGFAFVSSFGQVKPCGYFDAIAGSIREQSFDHIYRDSVLFNRLRDLNQLTEQCGDCEFKRICGGCRARALAVSGNDMGGDPACNYRHSG
jgi:radical SAM protein with 4Fe4S-binding SPASM domain